jgi:hypothetical protein
LAIRLEFSAHPESEIPFDRESVNMNATQVSKRTLRIHRSRRNVDVVASLCLLFGNIPDYLCDSV